MGNIKTITKRQLERYPAYLKYLNSLKEEGILTVSSATIANEFKCSEEQVRKDFQSISKENSKPGCGRDVNTLINSIENILGYNDVTNAILIGAGGLGGAILRYSGFNKIGLNILAGFDNNPQKIGTVINDKVIYSISELEDKIKELNVNIAILTVPSDYAQSIVDRLQKCNIKAIWNFVPVHLNINDNIVVENVDLAASLGMLSHRLNNKIKGE